MYALTYGKSSSTEDAPKNRTIEDAFDFDIAVYGWGSAESNPIRKFQAGETIAIYSQDLKGYVGIAVITSTMAALDTCEDYADLYGTYDPLDQYVGLRWIARKFVKPVPASMINGWAPEMPCVVRNAENELALLRAFGLTDC